MTESKRRDEEVGRRAPDAPRAREVGFVFQDPEMQFVSATVEREVAFGLENIGMDRREMRTRVGDVLAAMERRRGRGVRPVRASLRGEQTPSTPRLAGGSMTGADRQPGVAVSTRSLGRYPTTRVAACTPPSNPAC